MLRIAVNADRCYTPVTVVTVLMTHPLPVLQSKAASHYSTACTSSLSCLTQAGVVTVDGKAGWRLHCGFTEPQKFDATFLDSATSIAGGVAPLLAFYTRV